MCRRLVDRVLLFSYLISELLMFDTVDVEEGQPGILGIFMLFLGPGFLFFSFLPFLFSSTSVQKIRYSGSLDHS